MSVTRLRLMQQKQTALAKQARRDLAGILEQGREESAKVRVENIIRDDLFVEMLEILELYCELLLARFGLLEQMYFSPEFHVLTRLGKIVTRVWKKQ
jgi:vacuolar protein sorting-associated protein IST1